MIRSNDNTHFLCSAKAWILGTIMVWVKECGKRLMRSRRSHVLYTHMITAKMVWGGSREGGGFRMGNTCTPVADSC